jgi:hypothetical protein
MDARVGEGDAAGHRVAGVGNLMDAHGRQKYIAQIRARHVKIKSRSRGGNVQ